jgi:hypothetical protein
MLWIFPSRAQPAIVDVVKWTFAAARMSRASDRVIQSAADGIAQSAPAGGDAFNAPDGFDVGVLDSALVPFVVAVPPSLPEELDAVPASAPSLAVSVDRAALRRSFFAQPEPLKWTAGAAIAFRTGPDPHSGHAAGGSACTPWIASNRRPHAAQS